MGHGQDSVGKPPSQRVGANWEEEAEAKARAGAEALLSVCEKQQLLLAGEKQQQLLARKGGRLGEESAPERDRRKKQDRRLQSKELLAQLERLLPPAANSGSLPGPSSISLHY